MQSLEAGSGFQTKAKHLRQSSNVPAAGGAGTRSLTKVFSNDVRINEANNARPLSSTNPQGLYSRNLLGNKMTQAASRTISTVKSLGLNFRASQNVRLRDANTKQRILSQTLLTRGDSKGSKADGLN